MSHQIQVEGNFGSAQALKDVLNRTGVKYEEKSEGSQDWLTFPDGRYNQYGNALRINLTNPQSSTMDSDIGHTVRGWYQQAMVGHLKDRLLRDGHSVESEVKQGQDIVLRVAVG